MAIEIDEKVRKLLEEPNFANIATLMPDGSPQVTPVWVDYDGKHILFNSAEGRQKPRNIRRDPRVALSVFEQGNPYSMAAIRGKVVEVTHEGADEMIDRLAKKYLGLEKYPNRAPGEIRVTFKIEPEYVSTM
jgi:PPOX class probable F420-dependent enzyme